MIDFEIYDKVLKLIDEKFKGKVDKAGQPYIEHLYTVAEYATEDCCCSDHDDIKITAYLHDIFEDTDVTEKELREIGIPDNIIEALHLLTHERFVPYDDYVKKLAPNEIARAVKIADLKHNMDITRLESLDETDLKRLNKYLRNYKFLISYEAEA